MDRESKMVVVGIAGVSTVIAVASSIVLAWAVHMWIGGGGWVGNGYDEANLLPFIAPTIFFWALAIILWVVCGVLALIKSPDQNATSSNVDEVKGM